LLHAGVIPVGADWSMPAHRHGDHHELVMVVKGRVETTAAGRTWITPPGATKFHPRGVDHAERARGGPGTLLLLVWTEAPGTDWSRWPLDLPDRGGRLRLTMEWLVELVQDGRQSSRITRDALLCAVLDELMARPAEAGDGAVMTAQAFAREHLAEPLYLEQMARAAGMSRFHFARRFRAATGRSPMAWLRRTRVEAARSLLLTTTMPLRAIAPRVGFADEFQLSRVYRAVTGASPRGGGAARAERPRIGRPQPHA
jgi:AraC-like DNA-binding protein